MWVLDVCKPHVLLLYDGVGFSQFGTQNDNFYNLFLYHSSVTANAIRTTVKILFSTKIAKNLHPITLSSSLSPRGACLPQVPRNTRLAGVRPP